MQTLPVDYIWVELLFDDEETQLSDTILNNERLTHVTIRGEEENKDLFQKEALMNIGVTHCSETIKNLIFLDADVYCENPEWFNDIRNVLIENKKAVFQPASIIEEFEPIDSSFEKTNSQKTWNYARTRYDEDRFIFNFNPGMVWCMSRMQYSRINGLNPFSIFFGGDNILAHETDSIHRSEWSNYMTDSWMKFNIRKLKESSVPEFNQIINHVWHGDQKTERNYGIWMEVLNVLKLYPDNHVVLDKQNLLSYNRKTNILKSFISNKNKLDSYQKALELMVKLKKKYTIDIINEKVLKYRPENDIIDGYTNNTFTANVANCFDKKCRYEQGKVIIEPEDEKNWWYVCFPVNLYWEEIDFGKFKKAVFKCDIKAAHLKGLNLTIMNDVNVIDYNINTYYSKWFKTLTIPLDKRIKFIKISSNKGNRLELSNLRIELK